ncbi:MAG: amidohydrolase family protein [Chloroflexi bacterium]|nr:amidohydrolase family protein [Chloroflexota bacterium]
MVDLVIKNGVVVTPRGAQLGGVAIDGGKIVAVGADSALPAARQTVDVDGRAVLPGMIDPHTHMGFTSGVRGIGEERFRSNCASESATAVLGGVTTMISTAFFGSTRESLVPCLQKAKQHVNESSIVDFKLSTYPWNENHLGDLPALKREGVTSFKFCIGYEGEEAKEVGLFPVELGLVYRWMKEATRLGDPMLTMLHAEEPKLIAARKAELKAAGRDDLAAWDEARPGVAEAMDVAKVGYIAMQLGARLYCVHQSSKESVDLIAYFKSKGVRIFGETCPQYLILSADDPMGALAKINPPIRYAADHDRLWQGLRDGTIDNVGSDHAAVTLESKRSHLGIWDGQPGFPGVGTLFPLLLSEGVHQGRITLEQLVRVHSENTARIFGIYPQKGALLPGSDADVIVVDLDREWTIRAAGFPSASDFTVYEGRRVKGRVEQTYVRGTLVMQDGQVTGKLGVGRYVPLSSLYGRGGSIADRAPAASV